MDKYIDIDKKSVLQTSFKDKIENILNFYTKHNSLINNFSYAFSPLLRRL